MFQDNPDQFDTNEIDVRYVERGCLIVWTESSQYDLENEDKLKEDCIQFTKNMFQKCSLDSTETTNIKVNVKFSKTCQDSLQTKDDRSDYLHCGTCRQEFSTINTFISHKKECIRNRKINKQKQKDILKTDISKKTEDVALKTSGPIAENENIPSEIRLMSDKTSVPLYLKLLESGCEKKRDIRLVVVGMKGSGKTSFIKRLLNEDCTHVSRTNGIEVHRIRYNANSDDDVWKRLDDNKETSELHARLLKPYQETLISQNKGINKPSEESSAHKSIIKSLKRNESKQSEADSLAVVTESQVETPVTKEHQVTFSVATTSHDQTKILQLEQASREIETMLKSEVDLDDKEEYATLLLWDFAGDEEYYHTHQTFLSPDAIYLVFTKLNNVDDKEALDLFRLWMDSIHCYSTMNEKTNAYKDNTRIQEDLDPPVFIVGTWKDAVTSETEEVNWL
ncbi:uncharacterized protein LOC143058163 [Mytilus galloprovincialis]|uniref:uncharacterized protein LOC143058163 n=1 Tax=Mytilus galloprovincialis TaxID=29158 RepID=UPI003F7C3B12